MPNRVPVRQRFTQSRRRRPAAPEDGAGGEPQSTDPHAERIAEPAALMGSRRQRELAGALWQPSYEEIFKQEYEENLRACHGGGYALPPTTYRARLHGERAEVYDQRMRSRKRDEMACALHSNNMQHWSPSLLARSVADFGRISSVLYQTRRRGSGASPRSPPPCSSSG